MNETETKSKGERNVFPAGFALLLFEKDGSGVHVRPVRTGSPFEKYRGIGSPGIRRGRKAVGRWVRGLRGR